jgi:methionyl aminopeptidase
MSEHIYIMSAEEIEGMRQVGRLAARLLDHLKDMVKPGVSTETLDVEAVKFTKAHGATNGPLGYKPAGMTPFPKSICTSVNEVVCHGIPSA